MWKGGAHLAAMGGELIPEVTLASKLLTLQRDVRDVRLACFASFTSCLQLQGGACLTLADERPLCACGVKGGAGQPLQNIKSHYGGQEACVPLVRPSFGNDQGDRSVVEGLKGWRPLGAPATPAGKLGLEGQARRCRC